MGKTISELAFLRKNKHLTQERLSKKSGIQRSAIAMIESKIVAGVDVNPLLETALDIAKVVGIKDIETLRRVFLSKSVVEVDKDDEEVEPE
jgi:DNA-binding XRE family transcriptional regulator